MRKVGIIGCGAIGTVLSRAIDDGLVKCELVALYDRSVEKARKLASSLKNQHPKVAESFEDFLKADMDLVVEAASQEAVHQYGEAILSRGIDLMVMSVGALLDDELRNRLLSLAKKHGRTIYAPTGAIGALDVLRAARLRPLQEVVLVTRKPPEALEGVAYLEERGIDVHKIVSPTVVYEGPAREAVKLFPKNVNIAAALSLSSLGPDGVKVQIIVDPSIRRNVHEVIARGEFGEMHIIMKNVPSPTNPKTSYVAALSAIALLKRICEPVFLSVGT